MDGPGVRRPTFPFRKQPGARSDQHGGQGVSVGVDRDPAEVPFGGEVVIAETAAPLLTVAVVSAGLGLALAAIVLRSMATSWKPPATTYWFGLGGGLVVALALATLTALPMLARIISPETARFE